MIEKYRRVKQGMMADLLSRGVDASGKLRPPQQKAPELYKQSQLGWIPKDWEVVRLDDVTQRGSGHTPDRTTRAYWNGGIKWVSLADSRRLDNLFITQTEYEISDLGLANSSAVKHPAGTVILSRDAGIGKSAILSGTMADHQLDELLEQITSQPANSLLAANEAVQQLLYRTQVDENTVTGEEYRDEDLCRRIAFLKAAVVISSDGTNESAAITEARKHAREVKAVANFKKPFNDDDPDQENTGIAFLIVCDMLLTGFDAPIEQVMYIDKKVKHHNLLQTIARVNRSHTRMGWRSASVLPSIIT